MAGRIAYYGNIVTNGLVLNLDAGKRDSYPGSGTTWRDISGFGNSGSLINGPTYSSSDYGSIIFDGTNDYVLLPTNFFNHDAGTPFSVSMWFKTSVAQGVIFGQQNTNTPDTAAGWVPAIYINTSGNLSTSCFWGNSTSNISTTSTVVTNNLWYNICVTFENTSHVSYLNGVSFSTISKTQTNYASAYYYFIGSGRYFSWPLAGSSPYFNGSVSNMLFYTRRLTPTEVLQNYNALKGRFGL